MASPVHQLTIREQFETLSPDEKRYAHHMARAAWHGARIIFEQVSPESIDIYELILELYQTCLGDWKWLARKQGLGDATLDAWLEYAARFLSNVGNYYGQGDQKFIPEICRTDLYSLASASTKALEKYHRIVDSIFAIPPHSLGFPTTLSQSAYYPGDSQITQGEIAVVSRALESKNVFPENTRIRKRVSKGRIHFEILQASTEADENIEAFDTSELEATASLVRGDHARQLSKICAGLSKALPYASDDRKKIFISNYIESFKTGSLEAYRNSQRIWVADVGPRIENIFGFVEPYRDPYGIRAEFEGLVAIADAKETQALKRLVDHSAKFIKRLPWTVSGGENNGKGPFEKALFEPPDFASIHSLAYCSSIIFPGINLPNYNDIRQDCGFKNVIIANRMSAESNSSEISPFVDDKEAEVFHRHKFKAYYLWVVLHELLGHGTGKMMIEEPEGHFNFDFQNPPLDPLTNSPITSWYKPGQTWTGQFEDLATTVDECRAELVGAYLMDDSELLALFGFTEDSDITSSDLTYNTYLQLGIDGIRGLQNYNLDTGQGTQKWGQAHSRAHFAILKCMLEYGGGFIEVKCNTSKAALKVYIDRAKIITHADVQACRTYYEYLSRVDDRYLEWRSVVIAQKQPKWLFVHANTFLVDDEVVLKEYPPSREGVIQSWAERSV